MHFTTNDYRKHKQVHCRPTGLSITRNSLTYSTDQCYINRQLKLDSQKRNYQKILKLPHKYDEYRRGAAGPENTPRGADVVYVPKI